MENGETVKNVIMSARQYKMRIAFYLSNTKARSILSVLLKIQKMEKLGVQQK